MSTQRETTLGQKWAKTQRLAGHRARKIDAARNAGLPDWLHTEPSLMTLNEMKGTLNGPVVYRPEQLREDQRLSMDEIAAVCEEAVRVVVLDEAGFVTLTWAEAQHPLTEAEFRARREPYHV